jgi:hypothetical protein
MKMSSFMSLTCSFSSSTKYLKSKSSASSNPWLARHVKEPYELRARSAYRLPEINAKIRWLKPGAWTQLATQVVGHWGRMGL